MPRRQRRILLWPHGAALIGPAFLVALVLGGCSSNPRSAPSTTAAPSSAVATAPSATETTNALSKLDADGQRIYDSVQQLAVTIGPRVAGTPGEAAARDYIEQTLRGYGYEVSEEGFGFDATAFLPARIDAGADAIPAIAFQGSAAATASGGIVSAGIGRVEDMPPDLAGNIALMRRGGVQFNEMVRNAIAHGAVAAIIWNGEAGNLLASVDPVQVPVVSLRQQAALALADRLTAGPVAGKVTVSPPRGTAYNVVAKPAGTTTCVTVTGGHYDSVAVTGGADDNASGAAAVLEVARLAAAHKLPGDNCFVLFSAEEFGLFGSRDFVQKLSSDALGRIRAMLNLDVVGDASQLGLLGDADLVEQARVQAQKAGVAAEPAALPQGATSDHASFQSKGVPVVMFTREDNVIHTQQDALPRIELKSLQDTATVAYATLSALNGQ